MQSQTQPRERFAAGHLMQARKSTPTGSEALGVGTPGQETPRGYGPSSKFIITPETFQQISGGASTQIRYEIVLRLYETCYPRVYRFLRRSVSADVADDLAQETFLRLLSHKKLERMSISISYLFRIAQNLVRRRYNDLNRRRAFLNDGLKHVQGVEKNPGNSHAETVEFDSGQLEEAIDQLSQRERDVLKLIVCKGLSYTAAARAMGVPVSTVNNWKHRALSRLREVITGNGAELDVRTTQSEHERNIDRRGDSSRGPGQQGSGSIQAHGLHDGKPADGPARLGFGSRAAG